MTTMRGRLDDASRWSVVERLFHGALEQPRALRAAWLAKHADDAEVRAEVDEMLVAHERVTGILDRNLDAVEDVRPRLEGALEGRYAIVSLLGRGGSATVFLAREHKHDRTVVLKVLHPEIAAHLGVYRFLSEVRIAAQLSHPNILPLIDSGEADGLLYYVMPHLEGETLRRRLERKGVLAVREAVPLLTDIAAALGAVHAAGIIHRDLKPENVFCAGDHAYLLDFGIAVRDGNLHARHTQEGMVLGTVGYMSPEHAEGREVGPASDIFAWGIIAREMLTGAAPFAGDSRDLAALPPALSSLITRALDRDPAQRPSSANELLQRLGSLSGRGGGSGGRLAKIALAGAAVVALFALGVRAFGGASAEGGGLAQPIAVAPLLNETGDTTLAIWGRMAADWITQGLHETSLVRVVPWSTTRQLWDALPSDSVGPAADDVARETNAGTVVTGRYYRVGEQIAFRIDVADARTNKLAASLPAVIVGRDSLEVAVREVRDRLMGFVALRFDERADALPGLAARPPRFIAYRAFDRGLELYNRQEYGASAAEFRQAWSADTTFMVPLIYAAMAHWNQDDYEWVDTLVSTAQRRRDELSQYDQLQLDYLTARLASDGPRAIAAAQRAVELAPESRAAYNLARDLIASDRPTQGLELLQRIDPDRGLMKGWPSYWTQLAHARHLTGAHAEEHDAAREMRARFPESRVARVLEARVLAALGDTRRLDSLLRTTAALPAATYWSHGAALVVAGEELAVHHDSARGMPYLHAAVAWLRRELQGDVGRREHRYWLGSALYDLAQWRAADSVFSGLSSDFPDRADYRGLAALARARVGDRREAIRLLGAPPRFARGEYTTFRARLMSILGDTAAARLLRAQMLDEIGSGYAWIHASAFRDLGPRRPRVP